MRLRREAKAPKRRSRFKSCCAAFKVQCAKAPFKVQSSKFKVQGYMLLEVLLICSCSDFFSRKSFSMRVLCSLALMPVLPNV